MFGKKIKTAEELLKAYQALSEDEKAKFENIVTADDDETVETETVEEQGEETPVETETSEIEEVTEEEENAAPTPEETPETDENAEEEKDAAFLARLEAQDAQIADLLTKYNELYTAVGEIAELKQGGGDVGATENSDNADVSEEERDDARIMADFYGGAYRK